MAQIDLKHSQIFLEDGYAGPAVTGLVNLMAGYMAGATSIVTDGFTGAVQVGDRFTIDGDVDANSELVVHVVISHTETTMNTTAIVFTGTPLQQAILDNAVITILPNQLEVVVGEGNCTYTEARTMEYKLNRGFLSSGFVREGDDVPMDVKLDFVWEFLKASTGNTPTIEDVLKNRGEAANWVTAGADPCEPFAVKIIIVYTPTCTSAEKETITLPEFRFESLDHDFRAGTVAISGKCKAQQALSTRG